MSSNSKKAVIQAISAILKLDLCDKNKLTLVTSYGIITGKPVAAGAIFDKAEDDLEYLAEETGLALLSAVYTQASKHTESALSDDALLLSDVMVYPQAQQAFDLGQLIVFYDQIEAVTLGGGFVTG